MKVIFQVPVANVARAGEIREVSEGYARNFLFPKKLAAPATSERLQEIRIKAAKQQKYKKQKEKERHRLGDVLHHRRFVVRRKANEQGTLFAAVTSASVSDILRENGFTIEPRDVLLPEPIKHVGEYTISLKVGLTGRVNIIIFIERET